MAEFLTGQALSDKIREVVKGKDVRCAVAFWGPCAVLNLFGTNTLERADVKIICDISMGNSDPSTLRNIIRDHPGNHGHLVGLHVKLYHSDKGMVVGSANASNNGIGFERPPRSVEAGLFCPQNEKCWEEARDWFDKVWRTKRDISDEDIRLAGNAFEENQRARYKASRLATGERVSVWAALRDCPEIFEDIHFVFPERLIDQDEREEAEALARRNGPRELNYELMAIFEGLEAENNEWPARFLEVRIRNRRYIVGRRRGVSVENYHFAHYDRRNSRTFSCINGLIDFRSNEGLGDQEGLIDQTNGRILSASELGRLLRI